METGKAAFTLTLGSNQYKCEIELAAGPVRVAEMLPVLNSIANLVVQSATEEAVEAGGRISCKAGCGACCRQPVPVSPHELERLARVVADMDPERRQRVQARFQAASERLREGGILEAVRGIMTLSEEQRMELGQRYFALGIACPFLEEESCSIYDERPMRCREYLVTSPAEHCANPAPETVKMVELKAAPSLSLYTIGEGEGGAQTEFVVMTLLGEWAGPSSAEATVPAPKILQSFLRGLGGAGPKSAAPPE